jgi:mono/diheme cytochrome c family protein
MLREFLFALAAIGWFLVRGFPATAAELPDIEPSATRGYRALVEKAYLPPDFDQETFEAAERHWPESLRQQAEGQAADQGRQIAFARYGLTPRPEDHSKPLQYVVDRSGNWTMNCFACHGGEIPDGRGGTRVWPGAPNSRFALQTLTEETRLAKLELIKPLTRMDLGSALVPLGSTNGTTNAVMFGVVLMAFRDANLSVREPRAAPRMTHHDMDAPPWWHFRRKKMIYIDGFAEKGHRGLMQFMLVKSNGPEKFRSWELEFRDVFAYISSVQPPPYPYPIDRRLAEQGRLAFHRVCADCHGSYGEQARYPEKRIPIAEVGTDRVRLEALSPEHRDSYGQSWFAEFGRKTNVSDPGGYVAPPLDGLWASSPYFHNGSVPTLWHVLHPAQRPVVWHRSASDYDPQRVGWKAEAFAEIPASVTEGWQRREYFDTRAFGKSAAGHNFPDALADDEKSAVLEYLKTL